MPSLHKDLVCKETSSPLPRQPSREWLTIMERQTASVYLTKTNSTLCCRICWLFLPWVFKSNSNKRWTRCQVHWSVSVELGWMSAVSPLGTSPLDCQEGVRECLPSRWWKASCLACTPFVYLGLCTVVWPPSMRHLPCSDCLTLAFSLIFHFHE